MEKIQSKNIINCMMYKKRYFFAASLVLLVFISACSAGPDPPDPNSGMFDPNQPVQNPAMYNPDRNPGMFL